jgi:integrase
MRTFRERAGVPDFRFHDIRRTVATRLAEAGVSVSVIEAVLGHRPPRLVRTYQKHGYVPEMSAALNAWDARLTEVVSKSATGGRRSVG